MTCTQAEVYQIVIEPMRRNFVPDPARGKNINAMLVDLATYLERYDANTLREMWDVMVRTFKGGKYWPLIKDWEDVAKPILAARAAENQAFSTSAPILDESYMMSLPCARQALEEGWAWTLVLMGVNENAEPDEARIDKMRGNARFFDKSFGGLKALRRDEKLNGTQERLLSLGGEMEARERRLWKAHGERLGLGSHPAEQKARLLLEFSELGEIEL